MAARVETKEEILIRIQDSKERLTSWGVVAIGLFGSFERGDQGPSSDVDLLVEFEEEQHTFDNFMEVSFFLEEILGRKVELLTPDSLSPHIGSHILKEVERVSLIA